ncbi:unnamed protein product [Adineta ricciae]|uniref:G-protein coupled receptors family 1 profile domain-containing protein n=1 Tax=Adineta ricciae TaxID=249248 RepID=A0A815UG42_ADIRI|nr:unnamed protein product [Adineta ricciae]CAF1515709.1 unnamed protein product [Adineta ricciae]
MFVTGVVNSILTFRVRESREAGCGMYLLALSITSLLTIAMFTAKFWFLILTQINPTVSRSVLHGGCRLLEFILKVFLYTDNWFNACVALERWVTVYKGVYFKKQSSKRTARILIIFLPLIITISMIHEPLYRILYDDKHEQTRMVYTSLSSCTSQI